MKEERPVKVVFASLSKGQDASIMVPFWKLILLLSFLCVSLGSGHAVDRMGLGLFS